MWDEIFNHEKIQAQLRIKKLMMNNFDYEEVYYSVLEEHRDKEGTLLPSEFTDDEKDAFVIGYNPCDYTSLLKSLDIEC